jgi:hypothetical protein
MSCQDMNTERMKPSEKLCNFLAAILAAYQEIYLEMSYKQLRLSTIKKNMRLERRYTEIYRNLRGQIDL